MLGCDSNDNRQETIDFFDDVEVSFLQVQVLDPFDGPLVGTALQLLTEDGALVQQAQTDQEGYHTFLGIPEGRYEVLASREGFKAGKAYGYAVTAQEDAVVVFRLRVDALPSGGVIDTDLPTVTTTMLTMVADVFVVDENSNPYTNLSASAFSIPSFSAGTTQFDFTLQDVQFLGGTAEGPYSATLLFDQSGSIQSTDPGDTRIQAAKIFLSALGPGDNVILAAFSDGGLLPQELTIYGTQFTSDGPSYFPTLDDLPALEDGGTPLYDATFEMIEFTDQNGTNANKAVVVFTDGADTSSSRSLNAVIGQANTRGIRIFPVGLSQGVNLTVLGQLADQTGGTLIFADDARELVSLYGTLGALLRGDLSFYRTTWTVTATSSYFFSGRDLQATMLVDTPDGEVEIEVFLEVP